MEPIAIVAHYGYDNHLGMFLLLQHFPESRYKTINFNNPIRLQDMARDCHRLFLVGFVPDQAEMEQLYQLVPEVIAFFPENLLPDYVKPQDYHHTSMSVSGQIWHYLYPDKPEPTIIRLLTDYAESKDSPEFSALSLSLSATTQTTNPATPTGRELWHNLLTDKRYLNYQINTGTKELLPYVRRCNQLLWEDLAVPHATLPIRVLNAQYLYQSDCTDQLSPEVEGILTWRNRNTQFYNCSLYGMASNDLRLSQLLDLQQSRGIYSKFVNWKTVLLPAIAPTTNEPADFKNYQELRQNHNQLVINWERGRAKSALYGTAVIITMPNQENVVFINHPYATMADLVGVNNPILWQNDYFCFWSQLRTGQYRLRWYSQQQNYDVPKSQFPDGELSDDCYFNYTDKLKLLNPNLDPKVVLS